ncbi:MAG: tetratricopeptide repeat protein [Alphaproteobacteria bacterium]|nr:tetratricopeptide repeat protein [Alphaproteobacteria bacterium]
MEHWRGVARVAAKDDPLNADAWVVLGQCEYALSRYEASRGAYSAALQLRRNPATLIGLGDACAACRDTAGAVAAFQAALEIDPASGPALARLGRERAHAGNDHEAVPLFERAIELFSSDKDSAALVLVDLALSQVRLKANASVRALLASADLDNGEAVDMLFAQVREALGPELTARLHDGLVPTNARLAARFSPA